MVYKVEYKRIIVNLSVWMLLEDEDIDALIDKLAAGDKSVRKAKPVKIDSKVPTQPQKLVVSDEVMRIEMTLKKPNLTPSNVETFNISGKPRNDSSIHASLGPVSIDIATKPSSTVTKTPTIRIQGKHASESSIRSISPTRITTPAKPRSSIATSAAIRIHANPKPQTSVAKSVASVSIAPAAKRGSLDTSIGSFLIEALPKPSRSMHHSDSVSIEGLIDDLNFSEASLCQSEILTFNKHYDATIQEMSHVAHIPVTAKPLSTRCGVVKVGGTRITRGCNSTLVGHVVCGHLRCTGCDHAVLQIQDSVWTGLVDYMFFRNHYPSLPKLSERLKREIGAVAYCCQCSWLSATDYEDMSKLKWRCAGH